MRHVISMFDYTAQEIEEAVDGGLEMIPYAIGDERLDTPLRSDIATLVLATEPSTRTAFSYDRAARKAGIGHVTVISGKEGISLAKTESWANTIRMFVTQQGSEIITLRTAIEGLPRFATEIIEYLGASTVIHNMGDGRNQHPSQAFLDLVTIKKHWGKLADFTIGFVGDLSHSRTARALLAALRHFPNIGLRLVAEPSVAMPKHCYRGFKDVQVGSEIELLGDCDFIYVIRLQEERMTQEEADQLRGRYTITADVLDKVCKPTVKVLTPLPIVWEIDKALYEGRQPDSRVIFLEQARYGVPARMWLLRHSFRRRRDEIIIPEMEVPMAEELAQTSANARLKGKTRQQYFRPIKSGTVIDHLKAGSAPFIRRLLRRRGYLRGQGGVVHTVEEVPTKLGRGRNKSKDVILLEKRTPSDLAAGLITLFCPGAIFNVIRSGQFRKLRYTPPKVIVAEFPCLNDKCVTTSEPEAKTRFHVQAFGGHRVLRCHYCESEYSPDQLRQALTLSF